MRGVALLGQDRLELVPGDEPVAHEERAERRPGVECRLHALVLSVARARSVRAVRILVCERWCSG